MNTSDRISELEAEIKRLRKLSRIKRSPVSGIGGEIQRLREQKGLTLRALAREAGVPVGNLCKIEKTPDSNPELNTLIGIAAGLGMPLSQLIHIFENPGLYIEAEERL